MDTRTAGYQNKLLGAVAQTDYTGGLDCLQDFLRLCVTLERGKGGKRVVLNLQCQGLDVE